MVAGTLIGKQQSSHALKKVQNVGNLHPYLLPRLQREKIRLPTLIGRTFLLTPFLSLPCLGNLVLLRSLGLLQTLWRPLVPSLWLVRLLLLAEWDLLAVLAVAMVVVVAATVGVALVVAVATVYLAAVTAPAGAMAIAAVKAVAGTARVVATEAEDSAQAALNKAVPSSSP
jgi:hypothetical protein